MYRHSGKVIAYASLHVIFTMDMGYQCVIYCAGPMCLNNTLVPHVLELINIVPGKHEGFNYSLVMNCFQFVFYFMNLTALLLSTSLASASGGSGFYSTLSNCIAVYPARSEGSHFCATTILFSTNKIILING